MKYCNVRTEYRSTPAPAVIGLTMLLRTGRRPFRGWDSGIFQRECGKVQGCRFTVSYSNNVLTFCIPAGSYNIFLLLVSMHIFL